MKTFAVPTRDQVSSDNQAIFDNLKSALGFVPNLYATIGYSDNGLGRYLAYQNAKTSLSNKEKEALAMAAKGFAFKQIADELNLSVSAIEKRINPLYKRFNVNSLQHLVAFAYENNILP